MAANRLGMRAFPLSECFDNTDDVSARSDNERPMNSITTLGAFRLPGKETGPDINSQMIFTEHWLC